MDVFDVSWYEYEDSTSKRYEYDSPGWSLFDLKSPVSETIACAVESLFVQVTVSPGRMVTVSGEKPVAVIDTVLETVFWPVAADATHANASTAISGSRIRFIVTQTPSLIGLRCVLPGNHTRKPGSSGPYRPFTGLPNPRGPLS